MLLSQPRRALVGIYQVLNEPTVTNVLDRVRCSPPAGSAIPDFVLSASCVGASDPDRPRAPRPPRSDGRVSVEAGLGFEAAMSSGRQAERRCAAHTRWQRVLQDVRFGMSRRDAFQKLLKRTDSAGSQAVRQRPHPGRTTGYAVGRRPACPGRRDAQEAPDASRGNRPQDPREARLSRCCCASCPALFVVIIGPAIIRISDSPVSDGCARPCGWADFDRDPGRFPSPRLPIGTSGESCDGRFVSSS